MALTECPECRKDVSSEAIACPHCGYRVQPQKMAQPAPTATPTARGKSIGCGGYLAIIIVIIIVMAIIGSFIPKDPNYKAGYEAGKSIGQTERKLYDGKVPSAEALDREARIVGSTMCPDLHGDAFQKWVDGFKDGY
jgi:hypothetical protein